MCLQVERGTPFWNSRPNSRTSSPAPARASPAQRDSPAAGSRQTQQQQQIPITVPIQSQQQNHTTTQIRSQKTQQEMPVNVPIKTVPQQQQQGWGQKLAADSAGAATNAADFTKNFLSQLATSNGSSPATNGSSRGPAAAPSNGVQPNQLHNPGPDNESVGAGRSVSAPKRGSFIFSQRQRNLTQLNLRSRSPSTTATRDASSCLWRLSGSYKVLPSRSATCNEVTSCKVQLGSTFLNHHLQISTPRIDFYVKTHPLFSVVIPAAATKRRPNDEYT